ncbi:MAG: T9SS type A sorting domain-containing protein [Chitinophagales bacterium]
MKQNLLSIFLFITTCGQAQLSGGALSLYHSAYLQDSLLVAYTVANGAQIFPTPDNNSFYLQWFPPGAAPNQTPVVVSLPGSNCNAFMEFKSWYPRASAMGVGIIAIQYYRYKPTPPFDYFPDDTLYGYVSAALRNISYPSHRALLHGFSRGASRSYAMNFYDRQSGNNYFCTTIANSGDANLTYPLYAAINSGTYGAQVFAGHHWNLFCGANDTLIGCAKMSATNTWLQSQGATVDIFIQDPVMGHDGFQLPTSDNYKDSFLHQYLKCYTGALQIDALSLPESISVFPNPAASYFTIAAIDRNMNCVSIANVFGTIVKQISSFTERTSVPIEDLPPGCYQLLFCENGKVMQVRKLVVNQP